MPKKHTRHNPKDIKEDAEFLIKHCVPLHLAYSRLGFNSLSTMEKWLYENNLEYLIHKFTRVSESKGYTRSGNPLCESRKSYT